ncbi:MAG: rhomboid family intramembrane serine protease [Bacteroidales bacterium]|nr:rhomboid family intramembrane serine protease [Bacteroidales bacterium]
MNYYSPFGFRLIPPVVKNLLIINVLLYIGTIIIYEKFGFDLTDILGLHCFKSDNFKWYQIITHMFMHGSFLHLFSNMFALWMFGAVLENYMGSKRFIKYFFFSGIGAVCIHMLIMWWRFVSIETSIIRFKEDPSPQKFATLIKDHFPEQLSNVAPFISAWYNSSSFEQLAYVREASEFINLQYNKLINIPTVGASGAVFGLLLAFGLLFPNSYIYLYFFLPIKAKYFVILYGLLELYSGILNQPGDNVAHFAHLGGMIFGFIYLKFFWKRYY